jgi:hypothetical protein
MAQKGLHRDSTEKQRAMAPGLHLPPGGCTRCPARPLSPGRWDTTHPPAPRLVALATEADGVVLAQPIRGPGEPIHSQKNKQEKECGAA